MKTKQNLKNWIKQNKLNILLFIVAFGVLELLENPKGRSLGILFLQAVGFMLLFGIGFFITDYNHKNPYKISAFFKHNRYLLWIILGLIYIIAFPFIYVYYHAYIPTNLLIVLSDALLVVAFTISFTLAILLASYMLRHFRIIYYPKGRRLE
jgi:membrane protease YdiL (CAAX protease family)